MNFSKLKGIATITFQNDKNQTISSSVQPNVQSGENQTRTVKKKKKEKFHKWPFYFRDKISPLLRHEPRDRCRSFQLTFTEGGLSCDKNSAIQVMGKHTNRKSSTSCVIQTTTASPEEVQSVKTERDRKWKWNSWRAVTSSSPPTIGFSSLASATPPLPASFIAFLLFSTNSCKIWTKLHKFLGPFRFWLADEF